MSQDRLSRAFRDLQRLDPMLPYRRIYRAKVVGQSSDLQRVDVRPFDSTLPDMAGIELRHGVPGMKAQVAMGCSVQVGWDDGKPNQPFAGLWDKDARVIRLVFPTDLSIELGQDGATEFGVKGTSQAVTLIAAFGIIAGALTSLGKAGEASSLVAKAAELTRALSTVVKIGN